MKKAIALTLLALLVVSITTFLTVEIVSFNKKRNAEILKDIKENTFLSTRIAATHGDSVAVYILSH